MEEEDPEEDDRPAVSQLLVRLFRSLHDWDQAELAARADLDPSTVHRSEVGRSDPLRKTIKRYADAVGLPMSFVEACLAPALEAARDGSASFTDETFADLAKAAVELERTLANTSRSSMALLLAEIEAADREPWEWTGPPSEEDRPRAAEMWERLEPLTSKQRRFLVKTCREFHVWALAERLAHESQEAASDNPEEAFELAELACRVAELAPGGEASRSRLQGYTLVFLAHARRVAGALQEAEEEDFGRAWSLWQAGAPGDPGLLAESRLLDLKP